MRHADAHLAELLRHIDRRDPVDDLLVLGVDDLLGCRTTFLVPPASCPWVMGGLPGGLGREPKL
jgi:hypothetical protein